MKKILFTSLCLALSALTAIILNACENKSKDLTPPVISNDDFTPADCDIYYLGDTLFVHFICSDDTELGNLNIEIHNNFDHHTHGTSGADCDDEGEHHDEDEHHDHDQVEGAWVYNQDYAISCGQQSATIDIAVPVPSDVLEGDYHFMIRLTDRTGWQTIKAVPIKLIRQALL